MVLKTHTLFLDSIDSKDNQKFSCGIWIFFVILIFTHISLKDVQFFILLH